MTRNLGSEMCTRSRFMNKFCKNPTKENEKLHKNQMNKWVAWKRKSIKEYFHNINNNIVANKTFCVRSFLLTQGSLNSPEIMIRK